MKLDANASCYLLSERELKLLLAGSNASKYFGLLSADAAYSDESRSVVAETLLGLMQKESITSTGEAFSVCEPLKSLLLGVKNAERVILITAGNEFPLCCYASSTGLVTLQRLDYQPYMLRLSFASRDEICKMLSNLCGDIALNEESLWNAPATSKFAAEIYHNGQLVRRVFMSVEGASLRLNLRVPGESGEEYEFNESALRKVLFD